MEQNLECTSRNSDGEWAAADAGRAAGRRGRRVAMAVPARVAARPRPDQWAAGELLTLVEAAALFWPDRLLTVSTLRSAAKRGELAVTTTKAGQLLTSPDALGKMASCRLIANPEAGPLAMGRQFGLDRIFGSGSPL